MFLPWLFNDSGTNKHSLILWGLVSDNDHLESFSSLGGGDERMTKKFIIPYTFF